MPTRIFAITAARDTVTLDNQGRAEVSFTVSNTGPKPIAGRAKLISIGSTKETWLSLEGEHERKFAKGEAQQFTVKIAAPPGTPAGKYSFRLNIISVENPDDEFTEGPSVSFEVKEMAPAAVAPRKFPWWIVAVAGMLVLGAGIITWLLIPQKIPVPNIVGEDISKAKVDGRLRLRTELKSAGEKPGTIVGQNPKRDERVAPGTIITAFVEPEPEMVEVPGLIGRSQAQVESILKEAQLQLKTEAKSAGATPGTIVDQNPKKDAHVAPGTVVTAFVEPEPEMVEVPGLIGRSQAQVESILKEAQLQLKTEAKSAGATPGTIVDQNPKKDARVAPGTVVTAFVQPEPEMVEVPDVIKVPVDEVAPKFEGKKLQYYVIGQRIITGKVPVGAIAHQSPAAGQRVLVGTRVELAAEGDSIEVPNLIGKTVGEARAKIRSLKLEDFTDPHEEPNFGYRALAIT